MSKCFNSAHQPSQTTAFGPHCTGARGSGLGWSCVWHPCSYALSIAAIIFHLVLWHILRPHPYSPTKKSLRVWCKYVYVRVFREREEATRQSVIRASSGARKCERKESGRCGRGWDGVAGPPRRRSPPAPPLPASNYLLTWPSAVHKQV